MSVRYAFATLLTSDAYLPGALTIAAALKDVHGELPSDQTVEYETVCLVTPETVDVASIRLLRKAFEVVVGVETIVPPDTESLTLLGRPELCAALTKLHVFRLGQYSKVIFLDADTLPLRPLTQLFHLDHEFSAVPDVGWPDIFNSGVMVLSPGEDKFEELRGLLNASGSWDGADQGLLNEWRGDDWNRLSFTYNTTPTAIYTYAPAYRRFGSRISVVHFIGPHKPWHTIPYRSPGYTEGSATTHDYTSLVDSWYDVYDRHYRFQVTEPVFEPVKYNSVWNESVTSNGALGRLALKVSGQFGPRTRGDGKYQTLPLDGRLDLIRPRTCTDQVQIGVSAEISDDPVLSSIPATPHARPISLPPTPLRHFNDKFTRDASAQTIPTDPFEIGSPLLRYRAEENSPTPDRSKVKRVFPWEDRPRPAPGRVFPDEPSLFGTPEKKATIRSPMPSPLVDFSPSLQSYYPSEKFFTKRSLLSSTPLSGSGLETGSQDGDVEDEVDSEEETVMTLPKYRSVGVQTDSREVREEGVQVTTAELRSTNEGGRSPTLDSRHSLLASESFSSVVPPSPGGDNPFRTRRGSRVWDPARGVEAFKRGSEQVLTKFLKIGSLEEP